MLTDLPVELIEIIFFYLIDPGPCWLPSYEKTHVVQSIHPKIIRTLTNFKIITNFQLVNQSCLRLTPLLFNHLHLCGGLGHHAYHKYQQGDSFWRKYLPYVYHLYIWDHPYPKDLSTLTYLKSLDIFGTRIENYPIPLIGLKQIFCKKNVNISLLTKTNIHYHFHDLNIDNNCAIMHDYRVLCQKNGCLIRLKSTENNLCL